MEVEGPRFQDITNLIRQKILQLEFDTTERKLQDIEKDRAEQDQRIKKLIEGLDYDDRSEWIEYHRTQGNKYYQKNIYEKALIEYYLSILAFNSSILWREFGVHIIHNIQLNLENLKKSATSELLQFILYLDSSNIKAYYKMGKFYASTRQYQTAMQYLQQGANLCQQIQDNENLKEFYKLMGECRTKIMIRS